MERAALIAVVLLIIGCAWCGAEALRCWGAQNDGWGIYFAVLGLAFGLSAVRVLALPGGDD